MACTEMKTGSQYRAALHIYIAINNDGKKIMCHCNPSIKTPCCGRLDCNPKGAIDLDITKTMHISKIRSQEVLREKGSELSFDDLLAAVYFQAIKDTSKP